ncbi:rCG46365 [Rattus norvegicus]|uniref:RCG46365 n=1 Tax=Rattus norvegicus TaxID=10116 RepID=A6ICJ0_RAT|nr:rCG46365 [Rattus norvegicus]
MTGWGRAALLSWAKSKGKKKTEGRRGRGTKNELLPSKVKTAI